MRKRHLAMFAVALTLAPLATATAHPLIRMHCRILFNFDGAKVNAFGQSWTFDGTYSGHLLEQFDADRDGILSPAEVSAMQATVVPNLERRNYLTFVYVNDKDVGAITPYTFNAIAENGIVTVTMSMQLPEGVDPRQSPLRIEVRDPSYSVEAFFADQNAVVLQGNGAAGCNGVTIAGSVPGVQAAIISCATSEGADP